MAQLPVLNRLARDYPEINVVGIAPHVPSALVAYTDPSDSTHLFARFRIGNGLPIPDFPVVAACIQDPYAGTNVIGPVCKRIAKEFKVKGHPVLFFIDQAGIVHAVEDGFYLQAEQISLAESAYRARLDALLEKGE